MAEEVILKFQEEKVCFYVYFSTCIYQKKSRAEKKIVVSKRKGRAEKKEIVPKKRVVPERTDVVKKKLDEKN